MPNDSQDSAVLEDRSSSTERSSTLRLSSAPDPLCAVRSVSLKRERWILGKPRVRYFPSLGFHAYGKPRLASVWFSCSLSYPREGCQPKMWLNSFSVSLTSSRCSQTTLSIQLIFWFHTEVLGLISFLDYKSVTLEGSLEFLRTVWMNVSLLRSWWEHHTNLIQISSVYHFD